MNELRRLTRAANEIDSAIMLMVPRSKIRDGMRHGDKDAFLLGQDINELRQISDDIRRIAKL